MDSNRNTALVLNIYKNNALFERICKTKIAYFQLFL